MTTWQTVRESWRASIPDIESFVSLVSSTTALLEFDDRPTGVRQREVKRYLPSIQVQLLTTHLPTFLPVLDGDEIANVRGLIAPPKTPERIHAQRQVALVSYMTLPSFLAAKSAIPLPKESRSFLLDTLVQLSGYGAIDAYWAVHGCQTGAAPEGSKEESARQLEWETVVAALVSLPGKSANAVGRWSAEGGQITGPAELRAPAYFDRLIRDLESLLYELSQTGLSPSPLVPLVQRLSSLGLFASVPRNDRSPSFWRSCLPNLLAHLHPISGLSPYPPTFFPNFLSSLPSSALNQAVESLLHHLSWHAGSLSPDRAEEAPKRYAEILELVIGGCEEDSEIFEIVLRFLLGMKGRNEDHRSMLVLRGVVTWVDRGGERANLFFLDQILHAWTDTKFIRYALYAQQFALTYALLLSLSLLAPYHPHLISLSHQARFLTAMQAYISHPDPSIRRLGMLVAEVISERTIEETGNDLEYNEKDEIEELKAGLESGDDPMKSPRPRGGKRLKFGSVMWDGDGEGKEEARWLRSGVGVRDQGAVLSDIPALWTMGWEASSQPAARPEILESVPPRRGRKETRARADTSNPRSRPKIVMLDDEQAHDTLEGYDNPSPSSSRSPSPTPSYLEEVAADPSLALDAVQNKKVTRPVYISQLIALVKEREKPECIEMALKHGESLIRAKRNFGGELEENAVSLATLVVALNDPFNLDDFDEKRQGILNALVACSPRNTAPYLAELYFGGQFSLHQRSVILTALAMGARELAGLPIALEPQRRKLDFPSKTLPKALHAKYAVPEDFIDTTRAAGAIGTGQRGQLEAAVDDLRGTLIRKGAERGTDTIPALARQKQLRVGTSKKSLITPIDASFDQLQLTSPAVPVVPFKDVAAEYFVLPLINHFWTYFNDSAARESRARVRGDRYRGAGTGLILSPLALEKFLMTLVILLHAARHSPLYLAVLAPEAVELSMSVALRHKLSPDLEVELNDQESGVVGAALEVCLVCLDAVWELDGGRMMATTKGALVSAVGEWAGEVFKREEAGGGRLGGSGGMREGRVRSGAAGVVVKVSEILEKWGKYGIAT